MSFLYLGRMGTNERSMDAKDEPAGLRSRTTLRGFNDVVLRPSWRADGELLAVGSVDERIHIWDLNGERIAKIEGHSRGVNQVEWSPDGRWLASAAADHTVRIWQTDGWLELRSFQETTDVRCVLWSPDGERLISGCANGTLRIRDATNGQTLLEKTYGAGIDSLVLSPQRDRVAICCRDGSIYKLKLAPNSWEPEGVLYRGAPQPIPNAAWSPDGSYLAAACFGGSVIVVPTTGGEPTVLEGHTSVVRSVAYSPDGSLLFSNSMDGRVAIWRTDTWARIGLLKEPSSSYWPPSIAFNPRLPVLATLGERDMVVRLWDVSVDELLERKAAESALQYQNAKVVLVGDSGVGKSALALVLSDQKFGPTESTHGRKVFSFSAGTQPKQPGNALPTREVLLWDLAGQPGYRLIHRLHLSEVTVALVLCDARSETDPFAGVAYWARALDEAGGDQGIIKVLVAARTDRGTLQASPGRIAAFQKKYGFDAFVETSALTGAGVEELKQIVQDAIRWEQLPTVIAPKAFADVKAFLLEVKKGGRPLLTSGELYQEFSRSDRHPDAVFEACLRSLSSAGLIRRTRFRDFILLQPEVLDDYCSAIAFAAREEPEGLGYIREERVRAGAFPLNQELRVPAAAEPLVLSCAIEEIVGRGIGIRQSTQSGVMLVFPSELRIELPDYPGDYALTLAFHFEGPVGAIYATLAVSLIHSLEFAKEKLYRNAALFRGPGAQICGFSVDYPARENDAVGRLTVFFAEDAQKQTKLFFLRYINAKLQELALANSVRRERIYRCPGPGCGYVTPQEVIDRVRAIGRQVYRCAPCDRVWPLDDLAEESATRDPGIDHMDNEVKRETEKQRRLAVVGQREESGDFHVLLCHSSLDKPQVKQLANLLRERGVAVWLDDERILPGDNFVQALGNVIDRVPAVLVIIGGATSGRWQEQEYMAFLQRIVEQERDASSAAPRLSLIPVLLPGAPDDPLELAAKMHPFLRTTHRADFRGKRLDDAEVLRKLEDAILSAEARTGSRDPWE